jgi:hypothetical protein
MPGAVAEPEAAEEVPAPSASLVRSCAHDAWAPLLREHAHRSESIALPPVRRSGRPVRTRRGSPVLLRRRLLSTCSPTAYGCAATAARCVVQRLFVAPAALTRRSRAQLPRRTAADPYHELDDSAFAPADEESEDEDAAVPHFPELEAAIDAAIERLGGAVFPKLNWSAPKVVAQAGARVTAPR